MRIKGLQIINGLTHTDTVNRQIELVRNGKRNTAFGGTVEFGNNQPVQIQRIVKLLAWFKPF